MRAIEALLVLIGLAAMSGVSVKLIGRGLHQRRVARGKWTVATHSTGGEWLIVLECPGEKTQEFRRIPVGADATHLYYAQNEAQEEAVALNLTRRKR